MLISKPLCLVFTLLALVGPCLSSCQTVLPRERVRAAVKSIDALVVVHPTYYYDQDGMAKDAINFVTKEFLAQEKKVFTLVGGTKGKYADHYQKYFPHLDSTEIVSSENGENNIELRGERFVVIGGYLEACLRIAVIHLSRNTFKTKERDLDFFLPLPAIYRKDTPISDRDWSQLDLERYLGPNIGLKILLNEEIIYQLKKESPHTITIHFRGRELSPFFQDENI